MFISVDVLRYADIYASSSKVAALTAHFIFMHDWMVVVTIHLVGSKRNSTEGCITVSGNPNPRGLGLGLK
jgi:hypothetical protein